MHIEQNVGTMTLLVGPEHSDRGSARIVLEAVALAIISGGSPTLSLGCCASLDSSNLSPKANYDGLSFFGNPHFTQYNYKHQFNVEIMQ